MLEGKIGERNGRGKIGKRKDRRICYTKDSGR